MLVEDDKNKAQKWQSNKDADESEGGKSSITRKTTATTTTRCFVFRKINVSPKCFKKNHGQLHYLDWAT